MAKTAVRNGGKPNVQVKGKCFKNINLLSDDDEKSPKELIEALEAEGWQIDALVSEKMLNGEYTKSDAKSVSLGVLFARNLGLKGFVSLDLLREKVAQIQGFTSHRDILKFCLKHKPSINECYGIMVENTPHMFVIGRDKGGTLFLKLYREDSCGSQCKIAVRIGKISNERILSPN